MSGPDLQIGMGAQTSGEREKFENEVRRIVNEGYQRAKNILTENRETLLRIAEALLEREVLDVREVKMLIEGVPLPAKPVVVVKPPEEQTQQVLKPGLVRTPEKPPALAEGKKPAPA